MNFAFYLVTVAELETYKNRLPVDPDATEAMRFEQWVRPSGKLTTSACSFSRSIADDYALYREDLSSGSRATVEAFLQPTVFSCWREGKPIADLPIRGYEFSGALSQESRARLVHLYAELDKNALETVYRSSHAIEFSVVLDYFDSWASLLKTAESTGRFMLIKAG